MRQPVSYNDDLSLLGQRVRPAQPRTLHLYGAGTAGGGRTHTGLPTRTGQRNINFAPAPAKAPCTRTTLSRPHVRRKAATYALKVNNVDTCPLPTDRQIRRISEANSVQALTGLLQRASITCRRPQPPPPQQQHPRASSRRIQAARVCGVRAYERCFRQHCDVLKGAAAPP